jgi:hypothetical protein
MSTNPPSKTSNTKAPAARKRSASREDIIMRRIALYYVIGLCTLTELASIIAFFVTGNIEATFVFQAPALICLYKILCYLYPSDEPSNHPMLAFFQAVLKIKP